MHLRKTVYPVLAALGQLPTLLLKHKMNNIQCREEDNTRSTAIKKLRYELNSSTQNNIANTTSNNSRTKISLKY